MSNIISTSLDIEPLPLYSRDDPDASSVRSAAPSYTSDTPSYTSCPERTQEAFPSSLLPPQSPEQQTRGLPSPQFAPGFQSRAHGVFSDISCCSINSMKRSAISSQNSRPLHNVARRRASVAINTSAFLNSLSAIPSLSIPLSSSSSTSNGPSTTPTPNVAPASAYPVNVGSSMDPLHPHEDPYLVGEEAASQARAQRVYREMCAKEAEAARYEDRSWGFMLNQMSDW